MSIRSEREKSKMQEKYQMILAQMLKEDDNRFCVDCDTKSPRWASWNLGIFICIRCAGFHRNLGVHISKVKSVNLDSWTAEQIASMQAMGNNRARAVYEANLPPGFRRPQSDSALESFIRAKYEQRKWIAKEWIPPEITVSSDLIESETNQRRVDTPTESKQTERTLNNNTNDIPKIKSFAAPAPTSNPVRQAGNDRSASSNQLSMTPSPSATSISATTQPAATETSLNLLGLDEPALPLASTSSTSVTHSTKPSASNVIDPLLEIFATAPSTNATTGHGSTANLTNELHSAFLPPTEPNTATNASGPMSNDRILALFNTPQTSAAPTAGANIRPPTMQIPQMNALGFPQSQGHQIHSHQKSASFGSNLYQQPAHAGSQHSFQSQQGQLFPTTPSMSGMHHSNASTPTLQGASSTFTHDQLNNQFSQFVPFANSKTNATASALISGMPTRPVTEYMPASSDLLWQ